ncbi:MAG TPA: glycine cleavage system protein GcvH [Bacilli bacterium]
MSKVLDNLKYTKTHEWVKVEGDIAYIGITDYAQDSLGSIVYVEAREVGEEVEQFTECGTIESVKAAGDIVAPISGTVLEVNEEVVNNPELLNEDCYQNWILRVEIKDNSELNQLLSASEYQAEIE